MGNELKYDRATQNELIDGLMSLNVLFEKIEAVMESIMAGYFENRIVTNDSDPGMSRAALVIAFPHMQQLAFVVTDYLDDLGKAIKAMRERCTIHPELPQGK